MNISKKNVKECNSASRFCHTTFFHNFQKYSRKDDSFRLWIMFFFFFVLTPQNVSTSERFRLTVGTEVYQVFGIQTMVMRKVSTSRRDHYHEYCGTGTHVINRLLHYSRFLDFRKRDVNAVIIVFDTRYLKMIDAQTTVRATRDCSPVRLYMWKHTNDEVYFTGPWGVTKCQI
jgi:hypothetical protein